MCGVVRGQGVLGIKAGEFGLAVERAQAVASLLRQRTLPISPENRDDKRWMLAYWAEFFIRADYGELHARVVDYLIADGISDPCLAAVVPALLFFGRRESGNGRLALCMRQQRQVARRLAP